MDMIGLSDWFIKTATKANREDLEEGVSDLSIVPSKNLQDSGKD